MTVTREAAPVPRERELDRQHLDETVATLKARKDDWARMPLHSRLAYLESALDGTVEVAEAQVRAACEAKGVAFDSPQAGEEWLAGPVVQIRMLRLLLENLAYLERHGRVRLDEKRVSVRPDGQTVVEVFPESLLDKALYGGFRAEVWMEPDVRPETLRDNMAAAYRNPPDAGKVALVLGAGNVSSIGPLDAVHKLFLEGQVVVLKMNPVNDYLGPFVERTFSKLIGDGFMRVVYGGADVGDFLVMHPDVDEIHITGSDRTHDAIVYGTGDEGRERKARREPRLHKRITSELGNVTPVIVVPGKWSARDLDFHAHNIATQLTQNAGFNCNASRMIITHADWPQRDALLSRLAEVLAQIPTRPAYYPGAHDRYRAYLERHPDALQVGEATGDHLPWVVVRNVSPDDPDDPVYTTEAFCGLMGETVLGGADAAEFLERAVAFVNEKVWGTLSATVIIDPRTEKRLGPAFDRALSDLRYGTVAKNHWSALAYGLGATTWGAYPGHEWHDIQSGIGAVHNALLFDRPQKTVIHGPFHVRPKPPWFTTHANAHEVARRMVDIEAKPGFAKLPGLMVAAFKG